MTAGGVLPTVHDAKWVSGRSSTAGVYMRRYTGTVISSPIEGFQSFLLKMGYGFPEPKELLAYITRSASECESMGPSRTETSY